MRLAHFGTFDVPNYGDLLFPLIAEHALQDVVDEFVHISPIGGKVYEDVPESVSLKSVIENGCAFDAVLVGGGNLLHGRPTMLPEYAAVRTRAYPELWAGAAQLAARQGIPLLFNAPGIPADVGRATRLTLKAVANQSTHFVVRDQQSANKAQSFGLSARVVPDSALQVADVLDNDHSRALDLHGLETGQYIAVHVNDRYIADSIELLAKDLDSLAELVGLRVCLIAIGPCHGDDVLARRVAARMSTAPVIVDAPTRVSEIASLISQSRLYAGASLHGYITATSYGTPGAIVADGRAQHKFLGLLDEVGASARLFASWGSLIQGIHDDPSLLCTPADATDARKVITQHWADIREAIHMPARRPSRLIRHVDDLPRLVARLNWADSGWKTSARKMARR